MSNREIRTKDFQCRFNELSLELQNVLRRFLVDADKHGHHHMSGADFEGTLQELNNVLPVLMTLCPSLRPSNVGISSGDMVQVFRLTYSSGDLVIPDFILDEVETPMCDEEDDECGFPQRIMSPKPKVSKFQSLHCP